MGSVSFRFNLIMTTIVPCPACGRAGLPSALIRPRLLGPRTGPPAWAAKQHVGRTPDTRHKAEYPDHRRHNCIAYECAGPLDGVDRLAGRVENRVELGA